MTITVSTVQKSTLTFDRDATVLDLIHALTENLDGEWDDARLEIDARGVEQTGKWRLNVVLAEGEPELARAERWATEDGAHVAEVIAEGWRCCSCGVSGSDGEMEKHLNLMAGCNR